MVLIFLPFKKFKIFNSNLAFQMKQIINDWKLILVLCLFLGLAPFTPEPHLWGKIKWIAGGANGMQLIDWFDVLFHGFPFLLLLRLAVIKLSSTDKKNEFR